MKKIAYLILLTVSLACMFTGCKKEDIRPGDPEKELIQMVTTFLKEKRSMLTEHEGRKIDTLLMNLSGNARMIKLGRTDIIIADLKHYKNSSIPGYGHTYYKLSLPVNDGKISAGLIYTIHTNQAEESVDSDIENILRFRSAGFSGHFVTNMLNDRFVQAFSMKKGNLEKMFQLQAKNKEAHPSAIINYESNCTAYYLVTTTYYSDGHIEQDAEYLFTLCGECNTPAGQPATTIIAECNPQSGGSINMEVTDQIHEQKEEIDDTDAAAPAISYNYNATITRWNGEVTNVLIYPITVSNPVSFYIDSYGRNTTRSVTLFGHLNTWTPLGATALINWSCFVHGKWVYTNGNPIYTRQWLETHSAVR